MLVSEFRHDFQRPRFLLVAYFGRLLLGLALRLGATVTRLGAMCALFPFLDKCEALLGPSNLLDDAHQVFDRVRIVGRYLLDTPAVATTLFERLDYIVVGHPWDGVSNHAEVPDELA